MAHHEDSHDHGHDMTEGKRQYYPSGWYLPLVALVAIGLVFAFGAGSLLRISGTDKWGKSETHETAEGHGHDDAHHDAEDHATGGHEGPAADNHHKTDSTPAAAPTSDSTVKADSVAPKADAGHEGHGH